MPSQSGSRLQFGHTSTGIGAWADSANDDDKTVDVAPLMTGTTSSAERDVAWRIHRRGRSLPLPFSKTTAGSIRKFNDQ